MAEKHEMLTVMEMTKILRIGRSKGYELVAKKQVPFLRIGSEIRIPLNLLKSHIQQAAQNHAELSEIDMDNLANLG